MNNEKEIPSWDELLAIIADGNSRPDDAKWAIYRYLKQNCKTLGSRTARTLLAAYMKLMSPEPSLINSRMLDMALRVSEAYDDFRLTRFLEAWGYDGLLRPEDRERQTGKDGRRYLSLQERTQRQLNSYLLHHPEDRGEENGQITPMYGVSMIEKATGKRKQRFIKLVAPDGKSLIASCPMMPCRPYEAAGQMFDVLTRLSKEGKERAQEVALSEKAVEDAFPLVTGYVDGIDEGHGHIHVYDAQSRHFVARKESLWHSPQILEDCRPGRFVSFCPIIATGDRFKCAAITAVLGEEEGKERFGLYGAQLTYVNLTEGYVRYRITSAIQSTPEGDIAAEGFASTERTGEGERQKLQPGMKVCMLMFLKRGKDGVKRNYVARFWMESHL